MSTFGPLVLMAAAAVVLAGCGSEDVADAPASTPPSARGAADAGSAEAPAGTATLHLRVAGMVQSLGIT